MLINNAHEEASGGGGYWTHQLVKAVSDFCKVDLVKEVVQKRFENNPELISTTGKYKKTKKYDYFLDISHFESTTCTNAKKNIKVCYFPGIMQPTKMFDEIVTLSNYSRNFIKLYWGRDSLICQPYSKDLKPQKKTPKSIAVLGNLFYEADGHSKNQHVLIEAFKMLGDGWKMDIIGNPVNPYYVDKLMKMCDGLNVVFNLSASDEQKESILAQSEFLWHGNGFGRTKPEQTEHFGIAPEEGLKSGCKTYVHASGGAQDFCTSWKTPQELIKLTLDNAPNKKGVSFASHDTTVNFWKGVLI